MSPATRRQREFVANMDANDIHDMVLCYVAVTGVHPKELAASSETATTMVRRASESYRFMTDLDRAEFVCGVPLVIDEGVPFGIVCARLVPL